MSSPTSIRVLLLCVASGLIMASSPPAFGEDRQYVPVRGVNAHLGQGEEMNAVSRAEMNWVRLDVNWNQIQPTEDLVFYWYDLDRSVEAARSRGLRQPHGGIYATIGNPPAWACESGPAETCVPKDGPWRTFVSAAAQRYLGVINVWGVWNESDLGASEWSGTIEQWVQLVFKPASEALRGVASPPTLRIAIGDFGSGLGHSSARSEYWNSIHSHGWDGAFDIISQHAYEDSCGSLAAGILSRVFTCSSNSLVIEFDPVFASKPLWITEFGFPNDGGGAAGTDGDAAVRTFEVFGPRERVEGLFFYELLDGYPGGTEGLLEWVIFPSVFRPKAGLSALARRMPYGVAPSTAHSLLQDDFDKVWSGQLFRWTQSPPSSANVVSEALETTVTQGSAAIAVNDLKVSDFTMTASVRILSTGGPTPWVGLLGRSGAPDHTPGQSGYAAYLQADGVVRLKTGLGIELSANTGTNPTAGPVTLELSCVAGTITVKVNGGTYLSLEDDAYRWGHVSLQTWNASARFDAVDIKNNAKPCAEGPGPNTPLVMPPLPSLITVHQTGCSGTTPGAVAAQLPLPEYDLLLAGVSGFSVLDDCGDGADPCTHVLGDPLLDSPTGNPYSDSTFLTAAMHKIYRSYPGCRYTVGTAPLLVDVRRKGDVDLDNDIDIMDNLIIMAEIVGNVTAGTPPFVEQLQAGDTDCDEDVDIFDVVTHAAYIVGNVPCVANCPVQGFSGPAGGPMSAIGTAAVSFSPTATSIPSNGSFSVDVGINVSTVTMTGCLGGQVAGILGGYEIPLQFDPALVEYLGRTSSPGKGAPCGSPRPDQYALPTATTPSIANAAGVVVFTEENGSDQTAPTGGPYCYFRINLKAKTVGTTRYTALTFASIEDCPLGSEGNGCAYALTTPPLACSPNPNQAAANISKNESSVINLTINP